MREIHLSERLECLSNTCCAASVEGSKCREDTRWREGMCHAYKVGGIDAVYLYLYRISSVYVLCGFYSLLLMLPAEKKSK